MTPLQKQSYNLWFNHIANLIMQWSKEKPANNRLKKHSSRNDRDRTICKRFNC